MLAKQFAMSTGGSAPGEPSGQTVPL